MNSKSHGLFGCVALAAIGAAGCASSPAPPFDTLPKAPLTAFHLQNYETPQAQPATPGAAAPTGQAQIPGLPPELQAMVQQGAQQLQQFIPPGLLPPGLIPGAGAVAAAPAPAPAVQQVPRFPNRADGFPIIRQTMVVDEELKEKLAEVLGDEDSFDNSQYQCMQPELGLSFPSATGGQANELLISFLCKQVAVAGGFAWPHPSVGIKQETAKELFAVVEKLFPPGT